MSKFSDWSPWRSFPDPRTGGELVAPFGPGIYELRRQSTGELVLFGISGHLASRMTSLLPAPLGRGGRNNEAKRQYVLQHLTDIEYRTRACETRAEAAQMESAIEKGRYRFST